MPTPPWLKTEDLEQNCQTQKTNQFSFKKYWT